MTPTAEDIEPFSCVLRATQNHAESQFRAGVVVQVATLRLLIEKQIVTVDQAIQKIEQVFREFVDVFGSEDVKDGTQWTIDCLRGETPLHGSIQNRRIQDLQRQKRRSN